VFSKNEWVKVTIMGNVQVFLEIENPKLNKDIPVEDIVKKHLEVILLSMLIEKSMCGYDLIKNIFSKYNVLISQGTVYPLLYSLKEEGIIKVDAMKSDMRTKRYSVTDDEKQNIEKKIDGYIRAEEAILNSLRKSETYV